MAKNPADVIRRNKLIIRARLEATLKQSVQQLLTEANTPRAQGGNMRVDTGFLRGSLTVNVNAPPVGPSDPKEDAIGNPELGVPLMLAGARINDVIMAGWAAKYARPREFYDAFLATALTDWQDIVSVNAARAKREIK